MKKNVITLFAFAALSLTACKKDQTTTTDNTAVEQTEVSADAVKYSVDAAASKINWEGSKVTGGKHHGVISLSEGELNVKDGKIEGGTFTVDMNSITVEDLKTGDGKEDLEAHLKGTGTEDKADHFLNVKKYPKGTFVITSVTEEAGKQVVTGNLTLKEVTKSISFPVMSTVTESEVTVHGDAFNINRTLWNINFNSNSLFDGLGDKAISDDIAIQFHLVAKK